jgi:hypothetical protein
MGWKTRDKSRLCNVSLSAENCFYTTKASMSTEWSTATLNETTTEKS